MQENAPRLGKLLTTRKY